MRTNSGVPAAQRPDPSETVEAEPEAYTTLDEALMESFPASDPIAIGSDRACDERWRSRPERR
ncbi:MAG: hypothetical protein KGN00_00280 [Chloroflexota bacterium]|nr:hypothetical protein [Chloroflexota bacterium]MDE3192099.1 hypothetical protein [Chloroflexota bacterium]